MSVTIGLEVSFAECRLLGTHLLFLLSAENLRCVGGFFRVQIISCHVGKIVLTRELLELSLCTVLSLVRSVFIELLT